MGHFFEPFFGMEPIQNLSGLRIVKFNQPPNPTGAITNENHFGSQVGLTLTTAGLE